MEKQKIYNEIIQTPHKFLSHGIKGLKNNKLNKLINFDFNSWKELYDFLNPDINKICECKDCSKNKKFKSFTKGYNKFCSLECNNKWLSYSRVGNKNPIHRMTHETRKLMGQKNSKNLKRLISEGKFNPAITNSWCHSRYKIKFKRNKKILEQNVRSSWEAFFQLLNINFEYEKLRIPYFYKNEWHTYIVDFIDDYKKIVVEVKPNKERKKKKIKLRKNIFWNGVN